MCLSDALSRTGGPLVPVGEREALCGALRARDVLCESSLLESLWNAEGGRAQC